MKTALVALVLAAVATGCQARDAEQRAEDTAFGGVDTVVREREVQDTAIVRADTVIEADTVTRRRTVVDTTVTADTAVRKDTLKNPR